MELVLVANARIPSQRAQSVQVIHVAASFARAGARTTLLHAERRKVFPLPAGVDVFAYYEVPRGPRPRLETAPCIDWIDSLPVLLQYLPSRLQELTFARNAAKRVLAAHPRAAVFSREVETALHLLRRGFERVYLELHRVPGSRTRRRWLLEVASRAKGIVAISGGVKQDLETLGIASSKVRVEHDALEPSRFQRAPSRESARNELGLAPAAKVVMYTGGLLEWKGAGLLPEVARACPEYTFVIAGGMDRDVESLRQRAEGVANLRIEGFQPPARVPLYLAAADLAVVPNRSQPAISSKYTSPLKVFEAMAMGVPMVASDLPSLRELLQHEQDALLVAPDDPLTLAEGVRRLMEDGELRARMRQRLMERAPENTWDARARRILEWMEST